MNSAEFEPLLSEDGLDGWWIKEEVRTPNWENKAGVLLYKSAGPSLVSDRRFGDFEMELEYNLPKDCNCGVFLRGRYEVKLTDTPKGGTTSLKPEGRNGAIFSRIPASKNAYKGTSVVSLKFGILSFQPFVGLDPVIAAKTTADKVPSECDTTLGPDKESRSFQRQGPETPDEIQSRPLWLPIEFAGHLQSCEK